LSELFSKTTKLRPPPEDLPILAGELVSLAKQLPPVADQLSPLTTKLRLQALQLIGYRQRMSPASSNALQEGPGLFGSGEQTAGKGSIGAHALGPGERHELDTLGLPPQIRTFGDHLQFNQHPFLPRLATKKPAPTRAPAIQHPSLVYFF